jgi:hypothetical protein
MTAAFELARDDENRLVLRRPGREDARNVAVRRELPWASPQQRVSIHTADGTELLRIEDIRELPEGQRALIEEALSSGIFVPRIQRVLGVDRSSGQQQWHVITDRGETRFCVQERADIRALPDGRLSIRDVDGNVYEMPPPGELDEESRRTVEREE